MATYPETGLKNDYAVAGGVYPGSEIDSVHAYISTQLLGTMKLLSQGVSARYGATSFKVTAGTGLAVNIAAGAGMLYHSVKGAVAIERKNAFTLNVIPANSTRYLFATYENSEDNNTIKSGIPYFVLNETDVLANGLLLAKIVTNGGSVTDVDDLRVFATPERYRQDWDSSQQYYFNDTVTYNGELWYAKRDNVNIAPEDGDDWLKVIGFEGNAVTSVGLVLPGIFDVTGSPITTSGELTATLANQPANTVLAGPATGDPAAPTFRQLSAADIGDFMARAGFAFIGVADNTALRAVTTHVDRQIAYVESSGVTNGSFYHFDAQSNAVDDGDTVLQPTDVASGPGRWLRVGGGNGDADTLESQTGSYYLNRTNHSGEQAIDTITDLQTTLDGKLEAAGNLESLGNAASARSNLGLGSLATQAASAVAITGGTIAGIADLAVADGGTGASDAAGALASLGAEAAANKGQPNGYAALDGDGLVPTSQLPEIGGGGTDGSGSLTLDLTPGGTFELTEEQSKNLNLYFYGTLTENANIVIEFATPRVWRVYNNCTGGQTLTVKREIDTGVVIPEGAALFVENTPAAQIVPVEFGPDSNTLNHVFSISSGSALEGYLCTLLLGPRGETQEEVEFYANETEEDLESALEALDGIVDAEVIRSESYAYIAITANGVEEDGVFELPEVFGTGAGAGGTLTIDFDDDDIDAIIAKVQAIDGYEEAFVSGTGDFAAGV